MDKDKKTPVIDAKGLTKILMLLPGLRVADFRDKAADILVRYLGGDITLIPEIEKNNAIQESLPDKFGFIEQHKQGFCGLKLKSQNI